MPSPTQTGSTVTQPSVSVAQLKAIQGGCALNQPGVPSLRARAAATLSQQVVSGGQRVHLLAAHLPPNLLLDLIVSGPREAISGAAIAAISYSPPATAARTNDQGNLDAVLTLPDDMAAGTATVLAVPRRALPGSTHPTLLTSWTITTAARQPALDVTLSDAAGRPIRGANITYLSSNALSASKIDLNAACGQRTGAKGTATFSQVVEGDGQVIASLGNRVVAVGHPQESLGGRTTLHLVSGATAGLNPCGAHLAGPVDGPVFELNDRESGGTGAHSGSGPFGTFISGVKTLDTFTAQIDSSIDSNLPVSLVFTPASTSMGVPPPPVKGYPVYGPLSVASGATAAPAGLAVSAAHADAPHRSSYVVTALSTAFERVELGAVRTYVFPDVNLGTLSSGLWRVAVTIGTESSACAANYLLHMIKNPWTTPLGVITPVYDRASHAYFASDSLPNGLARQFLHFQQPRVPLGWDAQDVAGIVTIPAFHLGDSIKIPDLASTDVGIDVNERLLTSGMWDGTITAHAKVSVVGISLADSELPTFRGGGSNIFTDQFTTFTTTLATNNQLGGQPVLILPIGFPGIAGADLAIGVKLVGSADASVDVSALLNSITFKLIPSLKLGIGASAQADFAGSSAGASITGNLIIQSPLGISLPGPTISYGIGALFSVTGHAWAHFCFVTCDGPDQSFTLVKPTCLFGDCSVINAAAAGRAVSASGHAASRHVAQRTVTRAFVPVAGLYPAQPASAVSASGHRITLWVDNSGDAVRLLSSIDGATPLTVATNGAQIASPTLVWTGPTRALAVWVANTASRSAVGGLDGMSGQASSDALAAALGSQELYSAEWDGAGWSTPTRITANTVADSEPVLTAGPEAGSAILVWTHSTTTTSVQQVLHDTTLFSARYTAGNWSAAMPVERALGAHAPAVTSGPGGVASVAWIQGYGPDASVHFATLSTSHIRSSTTIAGFPVGTRGLHMVVDGTGEPVVVGSGATLAAARRAAGGTWSVTSLGAGNNPRLAVQSNGSVLLVTTSPGAVLTSPVSVTARVLPARGTWGAAISLLNNTAVQGIATSTDPVAGTLQLALQGATVGTALDPSMHLTTLDIPAVGQLSLVPGSLKLSPTVPAPQAHASLLVTVENTGIADVPAGTAVTLVLSSMTAPLSLTLLAPLAPGAALNLHTDIVMPGTALTVAATTATARLQATLGLPDAPSTLGKAVIAGSSTIRLSWAQSVDPDAVSYRIYRDTGSSDSLSMVGVSTDPEWLDTQRAAHSTYRYMVTTVDRYNRESLLSHPLTAAS